MQHSLVEFSNEIALKNLYTIPLCWIVLGNSELTFYIFDLK